MLLACIDDVPSTRPSSQVKEHLRPRTHHQTRHFAGGFRFRDSQGVSLQGTATNTRSHQPLNRSLVQIRRDTLPEGDDHSPTLYHVTHDLIEFLNRFVLVWFSTASASL